MLLRLAADQCSMLVASLSCPKFQVQAIVAKYLLLTALLSFTAV